MNSISKKSVLSGMLWRFLERTGAQLVTLAVTVIIARILDPDLYGQVALISVVIIVLQVFVDAGLGTALIQKKNPDDLDYSTVFYFNILFCFVAYALFYSLVPLLTGFYKMSELTSVMRVGGLTIVISGVKNVQQAYVSKNLLFKSNFCIFPSWSNLCFLILWYNKYKALSGLSIKLLIVLYDSNFFF